MIEVTIREEDARADRIIRVLNKRSLYHEPAHELGWTLWQCCKRYIGGDGSEPLAEALLAALGNDHSEPIDALRAALLTYMKEEC